MAFGGSSGNLLADRRFEYGSQMAQRGDAAGAADLFRQALEIEPGWPPLHFHLAGALAQDEQIQGAIDAYRAYLALDPADHMGATLKLALLGTQNAPAALPASYVQSLFDEYAPRFDDALLNKLAYSTPSLMGAMVRKTGRTFSRLLDLGCGTGLAAADITDLCAHKTGIDLSPAMVEQARAKKLYDDLHVATIEDFLQNTHETYDLILCADVLVYIGDLADIFKATSRVMEPDALFSFSVQAREQGDWTLGADHRYAHSRDYIERCAAGANLTIINFEKSILRKDGANDIPGYIVLCRK
jgi:predicted TPR repeat methyltransferase